MLYVVSIKHAKFSLLCCHCWWQRFFSQCIASSAVKLGSYDEGDLLNWERSNRICQKTFHERNI